MSVQTLQKTAETRRSVYALNKDLPVSKVQVAQNHRACNQTYPVGFQFAINPSGGAVWPRAREAVGYCYCRIAKNRSG